MNNRQLVVDAFGRYVVGQVLEPIEEQVAKDKGAVLIPFAEVLEEANRSSGWARRDFGKGLKLDSPTPKVHGVTAIFLPKDIRKVSFAAAFEGTHDGIVSSAHEGRLVLGSAPNATMGALARIQQTTPPIETHTFGKMEKGREIVVVGEANVVVNDAGYYELGMYGFANNILLKWLAIGLML